jgi:hypothetical protein
MELEPGAPRNAGLGDAPFVLDRRVQSVPNASHRNLVAWAIAARVAWVWLSELSSMKS